ncbi:RING-H2 finger protein ATL5 [Rhynchospora pubera]|uniref:RING-H2 finger protein ATL5 n=1 Tax=Rhynchospora pubera TaxID=906938 RepID=A0AAV8DAJ7_9POAL|nr:RING-H2 finger protein ATL5 [Rhynchospora pubera]
MTSETNPQASELHGRELSFVVAASVILIILTILFLLLWQHKRQQRDMNHNNSTTSLEEVNCQRVSEAVIEIPSMPVFVQLSSDKAELRDCAVCLAEFGPGNSGRLLPACGHAFHKECIDVWFRYRSTCPVCRANILQEPCANQKVETAA